MANKVFPSGGASTTLPAGAATAAKQPALGTAGLPSSDVLTVQGSASGTALPTSVSSVAPPSAIFAAVTNVTTAGVRVALGSQALKRGVQVIARSGNAGLVYVGTAAGVSSTVYGAVLSAGQSAPYIECDNLNLVGLDSATNGDGVSYIAS